MASNDLSSPDKTSSPVPGLRRSFSIDEAAQFRHRKAVNGLAQDSPTLGVRRRRSSNFSDFSLEGARKSIQSSTDDILLPKPSSLSHDLVQHSSAWHSVPLAFALLPAIGGMLFTNGSSVITDVMLLGLAAIFLNWSVRIPWDWYHSAQEIRKREEYSEDTTINEDDGADDALSNSQTTLEELPEEKAVKTPGKSVRRFPDHEVAANELYMHELLALLSCFIFPILGAYLLHTIRSQLTRPSEGLVSNYNLTIFLLASELRPMAHLVKLIQARTLHLQRIVNSSPYDTMSASVNSDIKAILQRVGELEAITSATESIRSGDAPLSGKQSAILTTEVRRSLQPDLDALNRATRRYEKRATLQAFQTESRLLDLEARLNDAISLAAAAADNGQRNRGLPGIIVEWSATAVALPLQALGTLMSLTFKPILAAFSYGKSKIVGPSRSSGEGRRTTNGKQAHGRVGDRLQSRMVKK